MTNEQLRFPRIAITTIAVHTITYFIAGVLALQLLDYAEFFASPDMAAIMRPTSDPLVMAGPLFQPLRGFVFALAIDPIREIVFTRPRGWLVLWGLFVALRHRLPVRTHPRLHRGDGLHGDHGSASPAGLAGGPGPAAALAFGVVYLVNHPEKRWLHRLVLAAFVVLMVLPVLGLLVGPR